MPFETEEGFEEAMEQHFKQGTGMKYDGGKIMAAIPLKDFNLAIKAVAEVGTFGANKYKRSSWKTVPDAALRYEDALVRHQLEKEEYDHDEESGLLHLAHFCWNALALLQLKLEEQRNEQTSKTS